MVNGKSEQQPYVPAEELLDRELGRVVGTFTPNVTPAGAADEHIRQAWVGVALPVREKLFQEHAQGSTYTDQLSGEHRTNAAPMPVYGYDACMALQNAGKAEAVQYWAELGWDIGTFMFRSHEGDFEPVALES
jgi:hypothetical protein